MRMDIGRATPNGERRTKICKTKTETKRLSASYRYHPDGCDHCCAGWCAVRVGYLAEGNTDGNLALYAFSGEDANGSPTAEGTDNLVRVTMDQGSDINWAAISVKLTINDGAPRTCDNPGVEGTGVCSLVEFGNTDDQIWSVGDGNRHGERKDLCSSSCTIDVFITDTREGTTIDRTNGLVAE